MDKGPAPTPGGGGFAKKKRRRRGGGARDGGGPAASSSGRGGGRGGGPRPRRGGRGGGGGDSSRFKPTAPSPLSLPHVKVTLRHVGGANHDSVAGVVESVKIFLGGAFPSAASDENDPYVVAWRKEKEEFDEATGRLAEAAGGGENGGVGGGSGAAAASSSASSTPISRGFSSGWVYEDKPGALPSGRFERLAMLPVPKDVVGNLMANKTEKRVTDTTNINWIVDTAMSQMMQECGKKYLDFVGGRIVFDEENALDVALAEKVQAERQKIAEEKKAEESVAADGEQPDDTAEGEPAETKDEAVEAVTKGVAKLSTSDKPPAKPSTTINLTPAMRVRILSVTPVKKSKRRGDIAGKVQLALYPPDPCLLFKEACRDAGKMAGERQVERANAAAVLVEANGDAVAKTEDESVKQEDAVTAEASEETKVETKVEAPSDANKEAGDDEGKVADASDEKKDEPKDEAKDDASAKPTPPPKKVSMPQIPYYPLLSPAERSRAVARSRVLLNRSLEALKIHAAVQAKNSHDKEVHHWEVLEATSQKTWKGRPHAMVGQLMAGADLHDLVVEQEKEKANIAGAKKGRRNFDSRADRYDSTIENSEDYKAFMESMKDGLAPTKTDGKDGKKGAEKKEEPVPVDEEGRPLSAIVQYFRAKQEEERKAKAEAAAAKARARAAATSAKEKMRKEKLKAKKEASRKKKRETARSRKARSATGAGGGGSKSSSAAMPPPGAMLLKKKGTVSSVIPPSGFG